MFYYTMPLHTSCKCYFSFLIHTPNNALCVIIFLTSYIIYTPILLRILSHFFILNMLSMYCILYLISSKSHFGNYTLCMLIYFPNLPLLLSSIVILCDANLSPASSYHLSSSAMYPLSVTSKR